MPNVTYIAADGTRTTVDVPTGHTVMEGAIRNGIRGIDADCGGCCSCATCHVFLDAPFDALFEPVNGEEDAMLDCTTVTREAGSRLSCQLNVTESCEGMVVRMPETQT